MRNFDMHGKGHGRGLGRHRMGKGIVIGAVLFVVLGLLVMSLWNALLPAIVPPAMTVAPKSRPTLLNEGLTLFGAHIHPLFVHTAVRTEHARTETQPTEKNAAQQQDPQRLPEANGFNPQDGRDEKRDDNGAKAPEAE
nr:hypothetical protein [Enterobacter hormaechei]